MYKGLQQFETKNAGGRVPALMVQTPGLLDAR